MKVQNNTWRKGRWFWLYSYLNLESTKPDHRREHKYKNDWYLNLEGTKTFKTIEVLGSMLYSYLNLESTKTYYYIGRVAVGVVQLLKSWVQKLDSANINQWTGCTVT